jgi:acyl carrier protein
MVNEARLPVERTGPSSGTAAAGSAAEVLEAITGIARRHLQWSGTASMEMPLAEAFELDSIRQLTLVIEIEDRFRIRLDEADETSMRTVGDLVDVILGKLSRSKDERAS